MATWVKTCSIYVDDCSSPRDAVKVIEELNDALESGDVYDAAYFPGISIMLSEPEDDWNEVET